MSDAPERITLWLAFLYEFAKNVAPNPSVVVVSKLYVAWRNGEALDHVMLVTHMGSRITRMTLNDGMVVSSQHRNRLGFGQKNEYQRGSRASYLDPLRYLHSRDQLSYDNNLHLELSVLDDELFAFADWLPRWICGRLDTTITIPPPPYPIADQYLWGVDRHLNSYAWSAAGWEDVERENKQKHTWLDPLKQRLKK